ncbi:MAG: nucleotidyltransferase domain-containing protein [Bacteroidota bacterium]|jgi:predicted nucleotidyltransferase
MEIESNIIEKIIKNLNTEFSEQYGDFKGIYLFGSRARGDFNEHSDYDLVLLFESPKIRKIKNILRNRIYDFEIEYLMKIDTHFGCTNDINSPRSPFFDNVRKEGIFFESGR